MTIIFYLIALLILGVIVFVHELGHFLVARAAGISVEAFSIGFGPEMIGFSRKGTRYRISWIPFGGYCKLKGELQETTSDSLYGKPHWVRILVLLAGSAANLLLAFVVMSILYAVGFQQLIPSRRIDVLRTLQDEPSPAWMAGLRPESEILVIGTRTINSYQDILEKISLNANQPLDVVYVLAGKTNTTTLTPRLSASTGMGEIGILPLYRAIIGTIITNTPAAQIDLRPRDHIIAVNEVPIRYYHEFRETIRDKAEQNVRITIERDGSVTNTLGVRLGRFEGRGFLGISIGDTGELITNHVKSASLPQAISMGSRDLVRQLTLTVKGFTRMFQGDLGVSQNVYGPIRIVRDTALIAQWMDFDLLMRFIAIISLGLGLANLLPIPGLDGGHIIINGIEWVSRRKLPDAVRITIENVGVLLLLVLAVWVLSNDISHILRGR